jgi:hypothetical protein
MILIETIEFYRKRNNTAGGGTHSWRLLRRSKTYGPIQVASRLHKIEYTGVAPCLPSPTMAKTVGHSPVGGGIVVVLFAVGCSRTAAAAAIIIQRRSKHSLDLHQVFVASQNRVDETTEGSIINHCIREGWYSCETLPSVVDFPKVTPQLSGMRFFIAVDGDNNTLSING